MSDIQNVSLSPAPIVEIEVEANALGAFLTGLSDRTEGSDPRFKTVGIKQIGTYQLMITAQNPDVPDASSVGVIDGELINADGVSPVGREMQVSWSHFSEIGNELHVDVRNSGMDYGVISVGQKDENGLHAVSYQGVSIADENHFVQLEGHLARTVRHFMEDRAGLSIDLVSVPATLTKNGMELSLKIPAPEHEFNIQINKITDDRGNPDYKFALKSEIPWSSKPFPRAVRATGVALVGVLDRYCGQATDRGIDQDFTKLPGAVTKKSGPSFSKSSTAPEEPSLSPSM